MKTWYFAKCEKCKEAINFFVNDPCYTYVMFGGPDDDGNYSESTRIKQWFQKHYGCELKLGWRDDHLDEMWDDGWVSVRVGVGLTDYPCDYFGDVNDE